MSNKFSKFKKIIFAIFILVFSFFALAKPSLAYQGTDGPSYIIEFQEALDSTDMNLQSFVNETFKAVGGSIFNFLIGPIKWTCDLFSGDSSCLSQGDNTKFNGLLPTSIMLFSGLSQFQPASGTHYLADMGRKIGIVQPTFAAANSFNSFTAMEPLQKIWTTFRNFSYILFVLILVAMGFAIMFRMKISPQAVITLQSALPKVVISLILITFSYAIVGLILDVSTFINTVISEIFVNMFKNDFTGLAGLFKNYEQITLNSTSYIFPFAAAYVYGIIATTGFFISASVFFGMFGILILLILGLLIAIAYLRALWVLIKAFAMIVINLIFAPIRILLGVLPGANAISDWFKDIISNVAILPGMLCMYFVGNYLILAGIDTPRTMATRPEGLSGFGIYGGFWMLEGFFLPIIGIFVLLMIPKVSDIIQSFIAKKPFQYGSAIGEAMGPVTGPIKGGVGMATSYGKSYITSIGSEAGKTWWGNRHPAEETTNIEAKERAGEKPTGGPDMTFKDLKKT